ncbi:MAG: TPM domain-containing protein [Fibrobacterota bacterium]
MPKILSLLVLLTCPASFAAVGNAFPAPKGLINDFAGLLTQETALSMETAGRELQQKTGFELAMVTMDSTGDTPIEELANRLYREWGIGNKKTNEGALLIVLPDRRMVRIENGYGAEGFLTDLQSNTIIRKIIIPSFKSGQMDAGIAQGFWAIVDIAAQNYGITIERPAHLPRMRPVRKEKREPLPLPAVILLLLLAGFLLMTPFGRAILFGMLLSNMMGGGRRSYSGGSGFGGGFGGGGFGGFSGGSSGGGGSSGSW